MDYFEREEIMLIEEYEARAKPRLEEMDRLAEKIDFSDYFWKETNDGKLWNHLLNEQLADEFYAGL